MVAVVDGLRHLLQRRIPDWLTPEATSTVILLGMSCTYFVLLGVGWTVFLWLTKQKPRQ